MIPPRICNRVGSGGILDLVIRQQTLCPLILIQIPGEQNLSFKKHTNPPFRFRKSLPIPEIIDLILIDPLSSQLSCQIIQPSHIHKIHFLPISLYHGSSLCILIFQGLLFHLIVEQFHHGPVHKIQPRVVDPAS